MTTVVSEIRRDDVRQAGADYSDKEMQAVLDVNITNYASAIVTTESLSIWIAGLPRRGHDCFPFLEPLSSANIGIVPINPKVRRSATMPTLLFTSLAMFSTLAGGYIAIVARHRVHLLMGFGAGVLLGAVFFDLLPESLSVATTQGWGFRFILAIVVIGFLIFYLVERLLVLHACPEGDCTNEVHQHVGRISSIGLIVHSTLDGAAIGAASLVNWRTGLLVALAVIAHDMSDGLNTILLVTHGEPASRRDLVFLVVDALAPVLGGLLALAILPPPRALAVFLAFASGFFLFTSTSDLLPEAHRRSPSLKVSAAAIFGIAFMAVAVQLIIR